MVTLITGAAGFIGFHLVNRLLKRGEKIIGIDNLFDYIFSAADLNAHKPDPVMFEAVINRTGLRAEEICHIGDHPINDVKASLDFGMTPVWFNYEKASFPLEGIEVAEFSDWNSLQDLIKKL